MIWPFDKPLKKDAGFIVLRGNLFDSAIMKTSVISHRVPRALPQRTPRTRAVRGPRRRVRRARGLSPPHRRSGARDRRALLLFMRGAGPIGYPGAAEVVNMQPPDYLIKKGITALPCIGDGRQSGTSGSPSILNASPGSRGGRRPGDPEDRRPRPHRPQQGHGRHPDLEDGARQAPRGAQGPWRLQISRPPDALAGNPARHRRSARRRHGAEAGGQIPAHRGRSTACRGIIIERRRRPPSPALGDRLWAEAGVRCQVSAR